MLTVIVLLPAFIYGLLLIPYVQTQLAHIVVNELSVELNTEISVEKARVRSFNRISLYNVLIKDRKGDSLLFVAKIDAFIDSLKIKEKSIHFNKIELRSPKVNVSKKDTLYNFSFLLKPPDRQKDTAKVWNIGLEGIEVINASLKYYEEDSVGTDLKNTQKLAVSNLNISVDSILNEKDFFGINMNDISFRLGNGFKLQRMAGSVLYSEGIVQLKDFFIKSDNSKISIDSLSVGTKGIKDFENYSKTSPLFLKVKQSSLSIRDVRCFLPDFNAFSQDIRFSGLINGNISNLKGDNINLAIGNNSQLNFNFSIDGLPHIMESFLYMRIESLTTDVADLEKILSYSGKKALVLPKTFSRLGTIKYRGNLTGFLSDLVAFGGFETNLGTIKTDLGLKIEEDSKQIFYGGYVSTQQFNIGELFGYEDVMGDITMDVTIKGSRNSDEHFLVFLEGNVDSLNFNKYSYKNIYLNGFLANQHFNGNVYLEDPNGILDFSGVIDMSKDVPEFDFSASVDKVKLDKFNFLKTIPDNELSVKVETKIQGKSVEDIVGYVRINDLTFTSPEKSFNTDSLILIAERVDTVKHILIESDLFEGEITGSYNFRDIGKTVKNLIFSYLPAFNGEKSNKVAVPKEESNDFTFLLNFKEIHDIVSVIFPKVDVSDEGMILGSFNAKKSDVDIEGELGYFNYNNIKMDGVSFFINSNEKKQLSFTTRFQKLIMDGFVTFDNLSVFQKAAGDSLQVNMFWNNWEDETNSGTVFTVTHFSRKERGMFSAIDIEASQIIAGDSIWMIQPTKAFIYPEGFSVKNFRVYSNSQQIGINGFQHKSMDDHLDIFLDNISLGQIVGSKVSNLELSGLLNSDIQIRNIFETPIITSNINIEDLVVNKDSLGVFNISSKYDSNQKYLNISSSLKNTSRYTLMGEGGIGFDDMAIDMKFKVDSLPMAFLNMYLGHILQDIKGTSSGDMFIKGTIKEPILTGRAKANGMNFKIGLLNTRYTLYDSVFFEPHTMIFDDMTVVDEYNSKGVFKGTIGHSFFTDMSYDLNLEANNTFVLNTTENDNEVYYGQAFVDGNMSITGHANDIKIDIVAKSVGDTRIFIPLQDNGSAKETDFIRFTDADSEVDAKDSTQVQEYHVDVSGMDITMDFEATPAAKLQLIFDSTVGDVLKGTGNGDLRIKIDKAGNVFFYGEYTIKEGDYMFTLQNVINKRFVINSGSNIRWDGSPYNALIDMEATYKLKASMYDLVAATLDPTASSEYQKRVPIDLNMLLSDRLLKPSIRFEIKTPSVSNSNQNIIDEYITTEEELNRQVLSLLVLNKFYAPEFSRSGESTAKASSNMAVVTTTEMLSNQLSHWLSQISSDVDIGVSYRPGDEITSDEIEVALSTQMFNNWVTLNSNVGYGNYQTENVSNIIGDFDVEVKLNKKGTIRAKAYTHSNNDVFYDTSPTTQGIGISFHEEFNTFGELLQRYWDKLTGKKKKEEKAKKKEQEATLQNKEVEKNEGN